MSEQWRYRGRIITAEEISFIRQFTAENPELSRWSLSRKLCEMWNWKQANGALRDMVCRGMLLMLERAGQIQLPAVRPMRNRHLGRARPGPVVVDDRHSFPHCAN